MNSLWLIFGVLCAYLKFKSINTFSYCLIKFYKAKIKCIVFMIKKSIHWSICPLICLSINSSTNSIILQSIYPIFPSYIYYTSLSIYQNFFYLSICTSIHPSVYSYIYPIPHIFSFIHLSIHSLNDLFFVYSYRYSSICSFINPSIHWSINSYIQ